MDEALLHSEHGGFRAASKKELNVFADSIRM
jgi:hypothetical protein